MAEEIADVVEIARAIRDAGGSAFFVGGWVRDRLLGIRSKDIDVEVYGLSPQRLEEVLRNFGEVIAVGRAFGVLRVKGVDVDFSLPRRDSKTGRGHRGFLVEFDPAMSFSEAALRRDLTMNAMGFDPLTEEVIDPHGGRRDLERKVLRAVDRRTFPEDSLRGLRVAQFAARFEMAADAELVEICAGLDLSDLPGERMLEEFEKLLLRGVRPSMGLEFLRVSGLLRHFPELAAMVGVPQDPEWHPEGTVWEHVLMVTDEAARLRTGDREEDLALMFGALCHDLGKPLTTVREEGRIRSPNHEEAGEPIARAFLERLRSPQALVEKVAGLARHHLAPANYLKQGASPRAYRRLARKLEEQGLSAAMLERVARADHLGRTTPEALAREFPEGEEFLRRARELQVEEHAVKDVVMGRHLIARGMVPGPHFGPILARCREIQEETGLADPQVILDRALAGEGASTPPDASIEVRDEGPGDRAEVRRVNELAFGRPEEAALVDALREAGGATISLVAVEGDRVVGHILFSPVSIESEDGRSEALGVGLGPLAVLPERQRQGIGSELVRRGLEECRRRGYRVAVVLGHPNFYPRFGFRPAKGRGLRSEYDAPGDAFMVAELEPGALGGRGGLVKYRPEFAGV